MARKKSSRRRASRARSPFKAARGKSRKRGLQTAGFVPSDPMSIVMGIGGALLMNAYGDRLPIASEKTRNIALTTLCFAPFLFKGLGIKIPKEVAPALIGAGIVAGAKTVQSFMPTLLPAPGVRNAKIGRISPDQVAAIKAAAARAGARIQGAVGVMNGAMPRRGVMLGV